MTRRPFAAQRAFGAPPAPEVTLDEDRILCELRLAPAGLALHGLMPLSTAIRLSALGLIDIREDQRVFLKGPRR